MPVHSHQSLVVTLIGKGLLSRCHVFGHSRNVSNMGPNSVTICYPAFAVGPTRA
jgi:hypothetical protein